MTLIKMTDGQNLAQKTEHQAAEVNIDLEQICFNLPIFDGSPSRSIIAKQVWLSIMLLLSSTYMLMGAVGEKGAVHSSFGCGLSSAWGGALK